MLDTLEGKIPAPKPTPLAIEGARRGRSAAECTRVLVRVSANWYSVRYTKNEKEEGVVETHLPPLRPKVFDVLGLIEDQVKPFLATEDGCIDDGELVGGDANMEGVRFGPPRPLQLSLLGATVVREDLEGGAPTLQLA